MSQNASWNGTPIVLQVNDQVTLPRTPNGTVILAALNRSTNNGQATIVITSGGGAPQSITLPAGSTLPWVEVADFQGNDLRITNISPNAGTPVEVQAIGPGIPGVTPATLPAGSQVILDFGNVAQGNVGSGEMRLEIQAGTANATAVGVIGGPQDSNGTNGKVIAVNAPSDTPPQGYYATTTANTYSLTFDWSTGGLIFVGNLLSPAVDVELETL